MRISKRPILGAALIVAGCLPCGAMVVRLPTMKSAPGISRASLVPRLSLGVSNISITGPSVFGLNASISPELGLPPAAPAVSAALPQPFLTPNPASEVLPSGFIQNSLGDKLNAVNKALRNDPSGIGASEGLERLYGGKRAWGGANGGGHRHQKEKRRKDDRRTDRGGSKKEAKFRINDEGVPIFGRAAEYYTEVRRMVELYGKRADLSHSLDVMDDSYADVLAKIAAIEALAQNRDISKENTHIEKTLTFLDAVLEDGKKKTAVHTHRVYFHKADNPRSEIEEGIRRVDGYIDETVSRFRPGGQAERNAGSFDEVAMVFDSRGYEEIKDHLKAREAEVRKKYGDRYKFLYLDEMARIPVDTEGMRKALAVLVKKYGDQVEGLAKIVEGVIYSRYVGLLLELKTVEHYLKKGYSILQSGEELFDKDGRYVTELDVVARSPQGETILSEAKSARVELAFEDVLADKVIRKLEVYKKYRKELEKMLGHKIDKVVFSMDVGPLETNIMDDPAVERRLELMDFLESQAKGLGAEFGFPVEFLFIFSAPGSGGEVIR